MFHYADRRLNHRLTVNHYDVFGANLENENQLIAIPGLSSTKPFHTLAFETNFDFNALPAGSQSLPRFAYLLNDSTNSIEKHENITDWGLTQFQTNYKSSNGAKITKQDIFYYTYAVLHSPVYRKKYEQNLKREFPRLPFYEYFTIWREWGEQLMDLHINYEKQKPFALGRKDLDLPAKTKNKTPNLFDDCLKDNDLIASGANPTLDEQNNAVPEGDELPTMNFSPSAKKICLTKTTGCTRRYQIRRLHRQRQAVNRIFR